MRARANLPIARAGLRAMFRSLPSATCLSLRLSKPSACGLSETSALSHLPSQVARGGPLLIPTCHKLPSPIEEKSEGLIHKKL